MKAEDWISFKERKPELGQHVILCYSPECDTHTAFQLTQWGVDSTTCASLWIPFVPPKKEDPCEKAFKDTYRSKTSFPDTFEHFKNGWDAAMKHAKDGGGK